MKKNEKLMQPLVALRLVVTMMLPVVALLPAQALAQLPARFYLDTLAGARAVPLVYESISGNTNPFDSGHTVTAGASFDATMTMVGIAQVLPLFDRSAMVALIVPTGRISGDVTVGAITVNESANGFGDPMIEFDINVIGPPAQKNIPDVLRYEPGFSLDLLADLALPIGEYDSSQQLNIGQNRWYGRLGAPMTLQIGEWVPGRRTTLEFLPSVWLFGDNNDFVGQTMETDPMYQLDAHFTSDLTEHLWASLDMTWINGGQATIGGVEGDKLNSQGMGYTLGYTVNDNLNLTVGYKSTINDNAPDDLHMDVFMVTLVFGWHPLLEGARRLKGE